MLDSFRSESCVRVRPFGKIKKYIDDDKCPITLEKKNPLSEARHSYRFVSSSHMRRKIDLATPA